MKHHSDGIVIAIDGPAASGKSSTARSVAADLGYLHLDSGAFYRAITLAALEAGVAPDGWGQLEVADLEAFNVTSRPGSAGYELQIDGVDVGEKIRTPEVNAHVSTMAAVPAVRSWLLSALRDAAEAGGLVADGRDIGTVVFPDAELKVFLVCDPEERAQRRLREVGALAPTLDEIRAEAGRLIARDRKDETRAAAPLLKAPDAVVLDTTGLEFAAQVRAILQLAVDHGAALPPD